MKVKIVEISSGKLVDASIQTKNLTLPGLHEGWHFAFDKQIKKLPNATAYVLVTEDTPDVIEGCLIFQMKNKVILIWLLLKWHHIIRLMRKI